MTAIGKVTNVDGTHTAICAREGCPWTFETTKDGEAAHELMDHNEKEHS